MPVHFMCGRSHRQLVDEIGSEMFAAAVHLLIVMHWFKRSAEFSAEALVVACSFFEDSSNCCWSV